MAITTKQIRSVSLVVIDREERGNSLDRKHAVELAHTITNCCIQDSTQIVALRGSGNKFFSTGIDLVHLYREATTGSVYEYIVGEIGNLFTTILYCQKPFISLVNGYALGLGAEIALLSDIAIGLTTARIGIPALKWGLVPPLTPILSSISREYSQVDAYYLFSSRVVSAEEAHKIGILYKLFRDDEEAYKWLIELAENITRLEPHSIQTTLHQLRSKKRKIIDLGLYLLALSATNPNTISRIREFINKREKRIEN